MFSAKAKNFSFCWKKKTIIASIFNNFIIEEQSSLHMLKCGIEDEEHQMS